MLRTLFAASLALPLVLVACSSTPNPSPATGAGGSGGSAGTTTSAGTGGQGTGGAPLDAGVDAPAPMDGGPDAPLDAATCKLASPFSSKNAACNACAEEKCCPEINGCLLDTACNDDYVNCSLVCAFTDFDAGADAGGDAGTEGCLADCAQQFPAGKAEYDTAFGCADTACATECQ